MPFAPPHPCSHPGCGTLARGASRCERHLRQERREIDARRGTAASRGYGSRWAKARRLFLESNPLCVECARSGKVERATVVDHIAPHKGDRDLFWDRGNWQPLCKRCHDRKTATHDGRWGSGLLRGKGKCRLEACMHVRA